LQQDLPGLIQAGEVRSITPGIRMRDLGPKPPGPPNRIVVCVDADAQQ
jgi:hypothetical protein